MRPSNRTVTLYHCTTRQNLPSIQREGLRVAKADPQARLKACWLASASNRPWGVLHTLRKHHVTLADVVVITVQVPRKQLTCFRTGLWYSTQDIPPAWLGEVTAGETFGASASE